MVKLLQLELASRSEVMQQRWDHGTRARREYKAMVASAVRPGQTILHAGCGWDKHEVTQPFRDECRVIGVDLDGRVESRFHSEFHRAGLADMPFGPETFDVILSEYVLE